MSLVNSGVRAKFRLKATLSKICQSLADRIEIIGVVKYCSHEIKVQAGEMLNVDRKDFKCSISAVRIYMNKNIHEHFLAILSISFMRYELFSRPMALI